MRDGQYRSEKETGQDMTTWRLSNELKPQLNGKEEEGGWTVLRVINDTVSDKRDHKIGMNRDGIILLEGASIFGRTFMMTSVHFCFPSFLFLPLEDTLFLPRTNYLLFLSTIWSSVHEKVFLVDASLFIIFTENPF